MCGVVSRDKQRDGVLLAALSGTLGPRLAKGIARFPGTL
jgi:hypothetical protein